MKKLYYSLLFFVFSFLCVNLALANDFLNFNEKNQYTYIRFGNYYQEDEYQKDPILWRVLYSDEHELYLMSEYILFNHRIHYDDNEWIKNNGNFKKTEIYSILNINFYKEAFSEEEKNLIIETEDFGKIYLPSYPDLKNKSMGFKNNEDRKAYGTKYAIKNGLFKYLNKYGGHSPYWTRSVSVSHPYGAICTKQSGKLGYIRVVVMNEGIRPVLKLNRQKVFIKEGIGTVDKPFLIGAVNEK